MTEGAGVCDNWMEYPCGSLSGCVLGSGLIILGLKCRLRLFVVREAVAGDSEGSSDVTLRSSCSLPPRTRHVEGRPATARRGRRARRLLALAALLAIAAVAAILPGGLRHEPAQAQTLPTPNPDGTYTVPRNWPLRPSEISPGTTFRLLFLTTRWEDATSTDIATYDAIVQEEIAKTSGNPNQIGHPAIRPYASLFRVVGSTASVDARDHTNMNPNIDDRGEHIYWLNGPLVAVSYNTFWRDTWENWEEADRRDQAGTQSPNDWPWTGTNNGGEKSGNPLGHSSHVTQGQFKANSSDLGPLNYITAPRTQMHSFYGISPVFMVEPFETLEPVFGSADPSKTTVEVLHSSYEGVVRYSYDGIDPYNRSNKYEDDRPGVSFLVDEHESCEPNAGSAVVGGNWHPDPSTYGEYRKLTYTVKLAQPPPTWKNAVVAIYGPDDKHPRDRGGFKSQYEEIFKKQLAINGRTSPLRGMGNQLPEGRVTVPTSRLVFSSTNWDVPQEVEVWVRCANPHDPWEDIHIFHGVYPQGTTGALGKLPEADWFEVTVTVIDANTSPRLADLTSADAYPGRVHVHLEKPGGGFNVAGGNWQVPIQLHWRTAQIDAFQAGDAADRLKVNDADDAMQKFRKFEVKVEGMAKGMTAPRSDGRPTYVDGTRLPTTLTWDVSPEKLVAGRGDEFENYYPAYFLTPDLTKDSVVHSPGSPIYRITVTPYSIRGFRVPGEAVQQCIHVRSPGEDPVTGVGATENKQFYPIACPSNFPNAPASQQLAEPPMLTISSASQWVDEGTDATFTITADRTPLLDRTVKVYLSQEMGEGLNYVGAEEAALITLPAGQRSVDWVVTSYSDDQERADGTIEARINPSDDYGVTNPRGVTLPLIDDDSGSTATISVSAGPAIIEGDPASFTVTATPAPSADLDVSVTVSQSGNFGAATGKRTVTIPTSGSVVLTIGTKNDGGAEADGSVTVTAEAGPRYTLHATDHAASVAVSDDDYQVSAAVLATVYQHTADDGMGNANRRVWRTVLIAFGLGEDNWIRGGMRAMTAASARSQYGSDLVWQPVIAELDAYEAAVQQQQNARPVLSITPGADVSEGEAASFTITATPAPQATLYVNVWVQQTGQFGVTTGRRQVVVPTTGTATLSIATDDDSAGEPAGAITTTLNSGNRYTIDSANRQASVAVADNDGATVDPQLIANVRSYMAETQHGPVHVNRWKRVLEAFGVEDYPGLEPMTSDEAKRKYGTWARWQPVIPVLEAIEAAPQTVVPQVVQDPEVSITAGASVTEGGNAEFTVTATPAPQADLPVSVTVSQSGDFGASVGQQTVTIPTTGSVTLTIATSDDSTDESDGSVTATVNSGSGYTVSSSQSAGTVAVSDNDAASTGPVLDAQLEADVRSYAAETHHGTLHVNRWKRVLEAFGLEQYPDLEPTTLDEARVHVDIGRPRWIPVLAHMIALDAVNPQPTLTPPSNPQVDAQVLATARSKAGETHHGAKHANRWKRVLEAFGDADYPNIEPITAAGAQVYANIWSGWTPIAAQLRLIEASATTNPPPVIPTVVIPPVVIPPTPEVNILSSSGGSEGATVSFTISANPAPSANLNVGINVVTTGDFGYGSIPSSVTIPPSGSVTLSITTTDDSVDESDGSVSLTINGGNGYTVGSYGSESVNVTDDDVTVAPVIVVPDPVVSISAGADITEGGNVEFTVTASPSPTSNLPVSVTVSQSGDFGATTGSRTVTIPTTGSATLSIATSDDSTDESDGSVTATVNSGSGYTVSSSQGAGTVAVSDNDVPPTPVVSITAGASVTEGGSVEFTVTASPRPTSNLPVSVTVSQSGDFGATTGSRTVTIPTSGSITFTIATSDDSTDEPDGSVTATLVDGAAYDLGSNKTGTVAVSDNDVTPVVSISAGNAITEGGSVEFTVTASPRPTSNLPVSVTVSQSGDFGASTGSRTVTIPTTGSATLTIATSDDSTDESDGSVTATVNSGNGYTVSSSQGAGTVDVSDNDDAPPTQQLPEVSVADASDIEGSLYLAFVVTLSEASDETVTVEYDIRAGTATNGVDYAIGNLKVIFWPGWTWAYAGVNVYDDSRREADETLTLILTEADGAVITDGTATGTILDDD